jgi:hypothetical protein
MIFPDTPEARREIDRQLDPDDPVLLESDRNRVTGSLTDIARILIRTARSLTEDQKSEIRGDFTSHDKVVRRQMGIRPSAFVNRQRTRRSNSYFRCGFNPL